jgi:hypothetical protein
MQTAVNEPASIKLAIFNFVNMRENAKFSEDWQGLALNWVYTRTRPKAAWRLLAGTHRQGIGAHFK